MSYVRWSGPEGPHDYVSDVYIYDYVGGGVECCGCVRVNTPEEMVTHVRAHIALGDAVPEFVIPRLLEGRNFN